MFARALRSFGLPLAGLVLFVTSSCGGGHTGLEIQIVPPSPDKVRAGIDFDNIHVEVHADGETQGDTFAITQATTAPYTYLAYMDGKAHARASLVSVTLLKGGDAHLDSAGVISRNLTDIVVQGGQWNVVKFDLSAP